MKSYDKIMLVLVLMIYTVLLMLAYIDYTHPLIIVEKVIPSG